MKIFYLKDLIPVFRLPPPSSTHAAMADTATDNAMADAMADAAADSAMADTAVEGAGGDAADLPAPAPALSPEAERFSVELEFVQCLASPSYLHCT